MSLKTLKWTAIVCFVVAMVILLGGGIAMRKDLPPYPGKVVDAKGNVLFEKANIIAGQNVYQRYGLMDQGAVWGHGSQRGPEFSATSLHIMAEAIGDYLAHMDYGKPYNYLDDLQKGIIDVKTKHETKTNRYDAASDTLTLTDSQVEGLNRVKQHWGKIFKEGY
jgi:nitric oxide reductase subunit B